MFATLDQIACDAAWMELRSQASGSGPEDREHAAAVAAWLRYWLSRTTQDIDPAIAAFITACAQKEISALAGILEAAEPAIDTPK